MSWCGNCVTTTVEDVVESPAFRSMTSNLLVGLEAKLRQQLDAHLQTVSATVNAAVLGALPTAPAAPPPPPPPK